MRGSRSEHGTAQRVGMSCVHGVHAASNNILPQRTQYLQQLQAPAQQLPHLQTTLRQHPQRSAGETRQTNEVSLHIQVSMFQI